MKWLDPRGRHLTHVCDRWSKSRATAIQLAFFNGDGYESWVCWLKHRHFGASMVRELSNVRGVNLMAAYIHLSRLQNRTLVFVLSGSLEQVLPARHRSQSPWLSVNLEVHRIDSKSLGGPDASRCQGKHLGTLQPADGQRR